MFKLTQRFCLLSLRNTKVWLRSPIQHPLSNPLRLYSQINAPQNNDQTQEDRTNDLKENDNEIEQDEPQNLHEGGERGRKGPKVEDPLRIVLQRVSFIRDKHILKFCKEEFNPPIQLEAIAKKTDKDYGILTFASPEEKIRFETEAVTKKLKNKEVKTKPYYGEKGRQVRGRSVEEIERRHEHRFKVEATPEEIEKTMSVSSKDKTSPLWTTPYNEQIQAKRAVLAGVLQNLRATCERVFKKEGKELPRESCSEVTEFIEANEDKLFNYRNKAEFTIGESYHEKGKMKVGFNVGDFEKGFMYVEDASDNLVVSKEAIELAQILEKYVQGSNLPSYGRLTHQGFWRNLVVRQSEATKEILVSVVAAKKNFEKSEYEHVKEELVELFTNNFKNSDYKIVSILMLDHSGKGDKVPEDAPAEKLYGNDYYMDEIMGHKFRVNASAFLQVNSTQCEKLYSLVKRLSNIDEETTFLDICCGIGTIGICVAQNAKKIVGVEMVERAISDAQYNSQLNGLQNTEYQTAKVESVIKGIAKKYAGSSKIIGVVDPPRGGLHSDVITALRTCKGLDKVIYVSCNPEGLTKENIVGLCLPETDKRRGPPFTVTEAYGVDLFPQTNHFEGVFVLERVKKEKVESS